MSNVFESERESGSLVAHLVHMTSDRFWSLILVMQAKPVLPLLLGVFVILCCLVLYSLRNCISRYRTSIDYYGSQKAYLKRASGGARPPTSAGGRRSVTSSGALRLSDLNT